jgi:hypothetical protein
VRAQQLLFAPAAVEAEGLASSPQLVAIEEVVDVAEVRLPRGQAGLDDRVDGSASHALGTEVGVVLSTRLTRNLSTCRTRRRFCAGSLLVRA